MEGHEDLFISWIFIRIKYKTLLQSLWREINVKDLL